jgi:hypothetical protein
VAKRVLKIEWRARPSADGNERLGLAMKLLIERAPEDTMRRTSKPEKDVAAVVEAES